MKTMRAFAFVAVMGYVSHVSGTSLLSGPFAPQPGTPESEFLAANEPAIMLLADQAREGETDARRAALETLANGYLDASLNLAIELIRDSDTAVAADSAKLLADTLAMVDSVTMALDMHADGEPGRLRVDAVVGSLREAVGDWRVEVRRVAAKTLAALGDVTTLDKIEKYVEEGLVPPVEAIDYFGLAPSRIGGPYIEKYLGSDSTEAQIAAVEYLGTDSSYRERIRELVLGDSQVNEAVLVRAACVLRRHDDKFPSYAIEVVVRSDLPPDVTSVTGRAGFRIGSGVVSPSAISAPTVPAYVLYGTSRKFEIRGCRI